MRFLQFFVLVFGVASLGSDGTAVLAQIQFPAAPFPFQLPTIPSQPTPQGTIEQIFNNPSAFATAPIATLFQQITPYFNISSLENFLSPLAGLRQLNANVDYDSIPQAIRESLQSAVDQFNKSVNASFAQGLASIENSLATLNETISSIITNAQNVTITSVQDIENRISKFNETVQRCFRDNVSQYSQIIPAARDNVVDCVNRKRNETLAVIDEGRQNIADAIDGGQNLSSTILACNSLPDQGDIFNFGVVGCYISAIFSIRRETILLPFEMARRFGEIVRVVSSTRGDVIECGTIIAETVADQTLNATQTISNCLIVKQST